MGIPIIALKNLSAVEVELANCRQKLDELIKAVKYRSQPKALEAFIGARRALRDCQENLNEAAQGVMKGYMHEKAGE